MTVFTTVLKHVCQVSSPYISNKKFQVITIYHHYIYSCLSAPIVSVLSSRPLDELRNPLNQYQLSCDKQ